MTLRGIILKAHLYMAMVTGLPLALVCVSGAALGAADLLSGSTAVRPRSVEPAGDPIPFAQVLSVAASAFPGQPVVGATIPRRPDIAYDIVMRDGRRVFVDPYRATVVDTQYLTGTFRRSAYQFHATLMAGEIGRTIVGISTLVSILMALSGLVLWWPRGRFLQALTMRWSGSWKRINFDLHNVVGFYSSAAVLLLALSGAAIAYKDTATAWLGGADTLGRASPSTPVPGGKAIPPAEALQIAKSVLPDAAPRWMAIPQNPRGSYSIFKQFPEDKSPSGMSRVFIDQFSGKVLAVKSTRGVHLGQRILDLNFPIHTGSIFGRPTQLLAVLVTFFIASQFVTGLLIWWQRKTPSRVRSTATGAQQPVSLDS